MKNYKRQYRQLNDETKSKISTSAKNKPKSEEHKRRIQQSMLNYWRSVPNKPESISMDDYLHPNNNDDNRQQLSSSSSQDRDFYYQGREMLTVVNTKVVALTHLSFQK